MIKNHFVADLRQRISTNPSIFTSDEYRAWLRRAPSSSAICEQMRASRDILNQQRAHRFSCSAENIHDALKNVSSSKIEHSNSLISNKLFIFRRRIYTVEEQECWEH